MAHSRQTTQNGSGGGDDTRMNLIIATATEFVKDVLDQVRMILEQSDHSMRRSVDNSLVERESAIIDGSLESTGSLMTLYIRLRR